MTRADLYRQTHFPDDVADSEITFPKRRKFHLREEDRLQLACIKYLRSLDGVRVIVYQPERIKAPAQRRDFLKALGLYNAGAPELIVLDARRRMPMAYWIELKRPKGRVGQSQLEWQAWLEANGYRHAVIRNVEELSVLLG